MIKDYKDKYTGYKEIIDDKLNNVFEKNVPAEIYEPLIYILSGGGKRIRPVLLLFSCEAVGGNYMDAIYAAVSVEMLHNFTLIHDDIMDNADKRRGKETIHKKWNRDVAILTGDALLGLAYNTLLKTKSENIQQITQAFTEGIIEVCEGQGFDKEFEVKGNVSPEEYLMMINKKTSQLLVSCAKIGALIGNADANSIKYLVNYAEHIGLAFQIQDDLLDITADEKKFGKKIGGDLREGKKTYLLLKALDVVDVKRDKIILESILANKGLKDDEDIFKVKEIYKRYDVIDSALNEIERYTVKANEYLNELKNKEGRDSLIWFSDMLLSRST